MGCCGGSEETSWAAVGRGVVSLWSASVGSDMLTVGEGVGL